MKLVAEYFPYTQTFFRIRGTNFKKFLNIGEVHEGVNRRNISLNISNVWGKYSRIKGADIAQTVMML